MRTLFLAATAAALTLTGAACAQNEIYDDTPAIQAAVAAPTRTAANRARDAHRHPIETLAFFGVKPTDTIVEVWPGGGWYTEILAPLARDGTLYAAGPSDRGLEAVNKLKAATPATYGKLQLATFPVAAPAPGAAAPTAPAVPAGTADVVVTFRNVHNWRFGGADKAQAAFDQMFAMLKPGGTLGVVEHRLPEEMPSAMEEKSGYMKRSSVVAFAEKAGFKLAAESQINANPKDTHDYPQGVWTLPPNYRAGDVERARYEAIGESDRMTLKFVKPAA